MRKKYHIIVSVMYSVLQRDGRWRSMPRPTESDETVLLASEIGGIIELVPACVVWFWFH